MIDGCQQKYEEICNEKRRKPEWKWYEHSAHLPNFEKPEKFCDFCESFLNEG
jgi:hypothetical protein